MENTRNLKNTSGPKISSEQNNNDLNDTQRIIESNTNPANTDRNNEATSGIEKTNALSEHSAIALKQTQYNPDLTKDEKANDNYDGFASQNRFHARW